jgi:hypothetical protein
MESTTLNAQTAKGSSLGLYAGYGKFRRSTYLSNHIKTLRHGLAANLGLVNFKHLPRVLKFLLQDTLTMDLKAQFPLASTGDEGIAKRIIDPPGDKEALSTPPTTEGITGKDNVELAEEGELFIRHRGCAIEYYRY